MSASVPAPVRAGFAPRRATPHPNPGAPQLPVLLRRQPTPPEGLGYTVTSYWEERFGEEAHRDVLTHTLTLHARPADHDGWVVTLEATAPTSSKPDLSALEQVFHHLNGLYRRLVLRLTPDGQLAALLNHAEVLSTWQHIRQELVDRSGGGADGATRTIVTDLDALLAQPGPLLDSLRYHYLYDALFANCYGQYFEGGVRYEQPRRFAAFFAGAPLCLAERLTVAAPPAPGRVALHCDGHFDAARTDRAALARCVDAAWEAAGTAPDDRPATDPAAVHAAYDAAYDFDAATGWPVGLELSVRCRAGLDYHKEYFLSLTPAP